MITDPTTHLALHTATTARITRDITREIARRAAAVPRSAADGPHPHARTLAAWVAQARRMARAASGRLSRS